jgi:hypothetical protein
MHASFRILVHVDLLGYGGFNCSRYLSIISRNLGETPASLMQVADSVPASAVTPVAPGA